MKIKSSSKKLKVLVSIFVYRPGKNLIPVLKSVTRQKIGRGVRLNVLVNQDEGDITKIQNICRKIDKRIICLASKDRLGFAKSVKRVLLQSTGYDVVVLLNDDIKISDYNLIQKILEPFLYDEKVGLVSGNVQPVKGTTFVERAIESSFRAYEKIRYEMNNGNNQFTCDGKVLALSKNFIRSMDFPSDAGMGNVDIYFYLSCLKNNFLYRHVKNAIIYYKNPNSISDYLKWFSRNNSNRFMLKNEFGSLVDREFKLPKKLQYYKFMEFLKNPLGSLFIFVTSFYLNISARRYSGNFDPLWENLSSTKNLN